MVKKKEVTKEQVDEEFKQRVSEAKAKVKDCAVKFDKKIKDNPYVVLGVAAGVAAGIGLLVGIALSKD